MSIAPEHFQHSGAEDDDASCRFILADDAPYLRNMTALWASDSKLAQRIEATHRLPSYPTQSSKSGAPTVSVPVGPGGRQIFLHSRYEPMEEASRQIAEIDLAQIGAFYVQGLGLGYQLQALFERTGGEQGEAAFFLFEPDLLLIRTALEQRDLSAIIASHRLHFFWRLDKGELVDRLTPHTVLLSIGASRVAHPPSLQAAPEFYQQINTWLDEFASFARTSLNTLLLNSTRTAENIARNVGWYAAAPCPSRLHDRFAGKPAIIVSAGPSLRKNKHLLKDARANAVLIAVQTTLKPMLEMGVEPHFVTSLDYHEICTRFFENLPDRIRTELVAEIKATSGVFRLNPGPLTLMGNDFAEGLLREMRINKAGLPAGATVAHLAYYLAEYMGCDPIIFVGQDLGFSDGLCYAPGTSYEDVWRPELGPFCSVEMKQWDQIVRERFILRRVPDHQGRLMYTEERLFSYLQQFEGEFLRSSRKIIDATEGGVAKRGAASMPLAEALRTYCTESIPTDLSEHEGADWSRIGEVLECLGKRREEAAKVETISRKALPLLEEIRGSIEDQSHVNRCISKIDTLRAQMNEIGQTYGQITLLTQKSQLTRLEADRRLVTAKVDAHERQRRQVERDILNVQSVLDAAVKFQSLMNEVMATFERDHAAREAA